MSIYYQDESSFEISQKMWRIICFPWEKARLVWREKRHDGMSISWVYGMNWEFIYRSSKSKKSKEFLILLKVLRKKEKKKWIVLVVDNARIHHAKVVKKYCAENNIVLVYLPPYSPEYNPIEFLRKRIKRMYRKLQWKYESICRWVQEAVRRCREDILGFELSDSIVSKF